MTRSSKQKDIKRSNFQLATLASCSLATALLRIHIPSRPLPQHILLNLPRTRLGQILHDNHLSWNHKPGNIAILLGPLDHLLTQVITICCSILYRNEGFGSLAPMGVRHSAHADFKNGRVSGEHGFEGDRGDVFAACECSLVSYNEVKRNGEQVKQRLTRDDDILRPIQDLNRTIGVPDS